VADFLYRKNQKEVRAA